MSEADKKVMVDIKDSFSAADDATRMQMIAYARGLNDGKKLARAEIARESKKQ